MPFFLTPSRELPHGVWSKIFDVCSLDGCLGRFRPLGHLFEWIDTLLLDFWLQSLDFPHGFKSVLQLIFPLLGVGLTFKLLKSWLPALSSPIALALSAWPLLTPQLLATNGVFFRPGKLAVAALLPGVIYLLEKTRNAELKSKKSLAAALASVALCWIDELATLVMGIVFVVLFVRTAFQKKQDFRSATIALGAALGFHGLTLLTFAPWTYVTFSSGRTPITYSNPLEFVHFNFLAVSKIAALFFFQIQEGLGSPADSSGFFWSVTVSVIAAALIGGSYWLWTRRKEADWIPYLVGLIGVNVVLYVVVHRHTMMLWENVKRGGYYFSPMNAFLYLGFLHALMGIFRGEKGSRPRTFVLAGLLIFAVLNAFSFSEVRRRALGSYDFYKMMGESREISRVASTGAKELNPTVARPDARQFYLWLTTRP